MIIITSLSPGHKNSDVQHETIKSWKAFGFPIYSMNNPMEVQALKPKYKGIKFIETHKTLQAYVNKPMISINAMIDFAIQKEQSLLIINSDIILTGLPELKQDGITIFSRYDFKEDIEISEKFPWGYDVFFIPKKFLKIFPPTIYAMGVSHWDHWLPMAAIKNNVPLFYPKDKHAFHKWHETQYHNSEWEFIGNFFKWQFGWDKNMTIPQIATATMQTIKSKLIEI